MAKLVLEEQVDLETLPADSILLVKVDSCAVKEVEGKRGKWTKLEFTFKVLDILVTGDGGPKDRFDNLIGNKVWGSVPFRLTDGAENKLRLWVEAILGMDNLGVGFELDTDLLEGRTVKALTATYEKRNVNAATGKPYLGHQVNDLLPANGAQPSAAAVVAATSTPDFSAGWGSSTTDDEPPF